MTSESETNAGQKPGEPTAERPEPTTDPTPPVGPGGVDAQPDWEGAGPDPVVPDPPRSAQVEDDKVPGEIDEVDGSEPDSAGAEDDSPGGTEEPAD